ncbi:MAG: phage tail tape measure protein [Chloroflexi bacterium]|nr:phage tail tape measure protein [Chloroflexota bacterium]
MATTIAQLLVKIGADISEAERAMQSVSKQLSSFGKDAAKLGGLLTLGVTTPLAGVTKTALDTATSYQSSMNMFQAVTGATADQMKKVQDVAIALGADMSLPATSAADAGRAMTELAKAGLSVDDTLGAAKGVLQLAAAGHLSEAQAAEIAANALNAFHLQGTEATRVADLLAAAANASSGEVTDMSDALRMSAAVFASAGQPIDALVTSISEMSNAGIQGQDAGTSLKQMLLSLEAPTDKAAKLMKEMGITIYDAQGKMLPFREIIAQFSDRLGNLTQQQRDQALATIFGSDAVRAANIVLMGGVKAYDQMHEAVTRQGAAAELAGARMKGLGGAIEGLKSQIETVFLQLATPVLGTLEGWVRAIADLIPKITELDPRLLAAAGAFLAVVAAAGPVIAAVGAIAAGIAFLLSPVGLVVLAVALLAAAWASDFGGIREITASVVSAVSTALSALRATAQTVFAAIQSAISAVMAVIGPLILNVMNQISAWWTLNLPLMQQLWTTVWTAMQLLIQTVMPVIQDVVTVTMAAIQDVVTAILQALQAFWELEWGLIQAFLQTTWQIMQVIVSTVFQNILDFITLILAILNGRWSLAWDMVRQILQRTWDALTQIVTLAADFILNNLIIPFLDNVQARWTEIWDSIAATTHDIWERITGLVKGGVNAIIGMVDSLITAWNRLHFHIPGFDVELPSVDVPGVGRVGGGHLGWGGLDVDTPDIPLIPMLAEGGIVTRPTLAVLGEAGPEAVVPLRNTAALEAMAERIADAISRRPTYVINAQYRYQDERSLRDEIRLLQLLGAAT